MLVIALASRFCDGRIKQKLHNPGRIIRAYCKNSTVAVPNICNERVKKRLSLHASQVAHQARAYPGFCSMKRLGGLPVPLDGMLVHRKVPPSIKFAGTHLYTWVERGTMGVKYLVQEHNTMSPVRARTRTARSGEHTNHEATASSASS